MKCLSIHLTDLCNSECTFCVVGSPLYTKDTVNYSDIISFLETNKNDNYDVVNLHGGEPTIHPRFVDTLDSILELGYPQIHLQTNGIKLAQKEFAAQITDRKITKFIISLHGDQSEYQDSQTYTKGGFLKTVQGIKNVKALGIHVRTNTVITLQNLERLKYIVRFACDLGVDHINLSNLHPVGSARFSRGRIMPALASIRKYLYPAVDYAISKGHIVTLEGFPYCAIDGGRERFHLYNEYRIIKMLIRGKVLSDYDLFMLAKMRVFGPPCDGCLVRDKCGGVYPEYAEYFGWDEIGPSLVPASLYSSNFRELA